MPPVAAKLPKLPAVIAPQPTRTSLLIIPLESMKFFLIKKMRTTPTIMQIAAMPTITMDKTSCSLNNGIKAHKRMSNPPTPTRMYPAKPLPDPAALKLDER